MKAADLSDKGKPVLTEIRDYRIEEAADALVEVLTAREPRVLPKKQVAALVAAQAERARRRDAYIYLPTIEGRTVKPPDERFILANWSDICRSCAAAGFYIVWQKGKGGRTRLGTLLERKSAAARKP